MMNCALQSYLAPIRIRINHLCHKKKKIYAIRKSCYPPAPLFRLRSNDWRSGGNSNFYPRPLSLACLKAHREFDNFHMKWSIQSILHPPYNSPSLHIHKCCLSMFPSQLDISECLMNSNLTIFGIIGQFSSTKWQKIPLSHGTIFMVT